MATTYSPQFTLYNSCKFFFDPANVRSYPGSGSALNSLLKVVPCTITGSSFSTESMGVLVLNGTTTSGNAVQSGSFPSSSVFQHTLEMVIQPTGTPATDQYIFHFGLSIDNNHTILRTASNVLQVAVYGTAGNTVIHTYQMSVDTWYHVVSTYDGVTSKLYINGVLISSAAATFTVPSKVITMFGRLDATLKYVGKAGIIRGYDIMLSEEEVRMVFNSIRGRYGL